MARNRNENQLELLPARPESHGDPCSVELPLSDLTHIHILGVSIPCQTSRWFHLLEVSSYSYLRNSVGRHACESKDVSKYTILCILCV